MVNTIESIIKHKEFTPEFRISQSNEIIEIVNNYAKREKCLSQSMIQYGGHICYRISNLCQDHKKSRVWNK